MRAANSLSSGTAQTYRRPRPGFPGRTTNGERATSLASLPVKGSSPDGRHRQHGLRPGAVGAQREPNLRVHFTTGGAPMSNPSRFLYLFLNVMYGASIGAGIALVVHEPESWTDRP